MVSAFRFSFKADVLTITSQKTANIFRAITGYLRKMLMNRFFKASTTFTTILFGTDHYNQR